jgi:predicted MFS family arabinose efflux permease
MQPTTRNELSALSSRRSSARSGGRYGWVIAAVAALTVLGALGFGRHGYTVILASMKEGLGLSEVQAGDLATGNLVGYLVSSVLCGLLASRFGPRVVITVSLFAVAAAMLLTGWASTFRGALIARILTGVASGGANVPAMGLVSSWFHSRRRGLATGIAVSGSSFGLLITGLAVPAILLRYGPSGWRVAWLCLGAGALLIAIICAGLARNSPTAGRSPAAVKGAAPRPLLRVISSGRIWFLAGIYLLFGFSYIIYSTFFVRFLTAEAGFSTRTAGAMWSGIGLVSIASGFLWGIVSDRLGRKYGLAMVFFLQCVSFSLFGLWQVPAGYWVSAALFALTAWSIPAIMAASAGDVMGARLASGALGLLTLFFGIGQAAGPFVAGRIAHFTGSYSGAFLLAGGAALAGALLSLALRLKKPDDLAA